MHLVGLRERQGFSNEATKPLPESTVEALNVICQTCVFTNGLVSLFRENNLVGFPKIAVADALLIRFRYRTP